MQSLSRTRAHVVSAAASGCASIVWALLVPAGVAAADTITVPCGDSAALIRAIDTANSAGTATTINLGNGLGPCTFVLTAPAVPAATTACL